MEPKFRMAISPSDLSEMERIFGEQSRNTAQHAFRYNYSTDCWELWEFDLALGTKVATVSVNDAGIWQEL